MISYYMRATSREELVAIGVDLDLLIDDVDGTRAASAEIVWDEIGTIYAPTGELDEEGVPLTAPVTDEHGNVYWHANLYMPHDLTALAQAKAAEYAGTARGERIVASLTNSASYFPLDELGRPRKPNRPARVLWT